MITKIFSWINRYYNNLVAIKQGMVSSDKIQDHLTQNTEIKNLLLFLQDVPIGREVSAEDNLNTNTSGSTGGMNFMNEIYGDPE